MRWLVITLALLALVVGCTRNRPSDKTPIHLNQNMDDQEKYKAQAASPFFNDGKAMRNPVEGTVARGQLRENVVYYTGKDQNGKLVKESPVPLTMDLLKRGQERYDIYCSPCHGRIGDAQSMVVKRGWVPPPASLHDDRLRDIEDGHIFDVITNGIRNMPAYKYQIPVEDRWAIVAYFRALQKSQNASADEVPASARRSN
jgi:mono/diheme cytochrome c family protein